MAWVLTDESQYGTIEEIAKATPRAAAIVAMTILENRLTTAIESRLHPMSKTVRDRLFGEHGNLRNVTARIDLAYGLGLYGKEAHCDMLKIYKIRNYFAHHESVRTFEHSKIDELVRDLRLYKRLKDPKTLHKPLNTNEGKFLRCVQILLAYLHSETVANSPKTHIA